MRHFRRHADAFAQRGVRVDGLADVHRVGAHLDGQGDFADHVAGMGADDAAAHIAVGFPMKQLCAETRLCTIDPIRSNALVKRRVALGLHCTGGVTAQTPTRST